MQGMRSRRTRQVKPGGQLLNISYIPVIEESYAAQLREEALQIDPNSKVQGQYPGPVGVVEWALPAVIAFVVGGISTSIFQEAGKDIYHGLKKLIVEAYNEASQSPYEWQSQRKEPTLDEPAEIETSAAEQSLPKAQATSPPLKLTLRIDDWDGQLSFIFFKDLTSEQVADAYNAIPKTAQTILDYCSYVYTQLKCKRDRPKLYQGSMPDSFWEERLEYEVSEAALLLHAVFVFDTEERVWVRVH